MRIERSRDECVSFFFFVQLVKSSPFCHTFNHVFHSRQIEKFSVQIFNLISFQWRDDVLSLENLFAYTIYNHGKMPTIYCIGTSHLLAFSHNSANSFSHSLSSFSYSFLFYIHIKVAHFFEVLNYFHCNRTEMY